MLITPTAKNCLRNQEAFLSTLKDTDRYHQEKEKFITMIRLAQSINVDVSEFSYIFLE